ncbi:MAG TPA: hypothetical protein VEC37_05720 [Bacillota bacterium]|nr:hypothetical protein [Bacillota bacterium]
MELPYGLKEEALQLVGEGSQGKVYLIDPFRCIKIYKRKEFLALELEVLQKAHNEPQFPNVYEWGDEYMIREYFPGTDLKKYLRKNGLAVEMSRQIVELFQAFERVGFNRLDTRMAHMIVTPEGQLKAIDPANAMRKQGSYPKKFLSQLSDLKLKKTFFKHLQIINPEYYKKWR